MIFFWAITGLSCLIWLYLLGFWGKFWLADQRLEPMMFPLSHYPSVCVVIPARNEADVLPISLKSLLCQEYGGDYSLILVDDQSDDGTGEIAQQIAQQLQQSQRLSVIKGQPLAQGWSGKLYAMEQGIRYIQQQTIPCEYILFTDADIEHHSTNLQELVTKSVSENLALTSLMVRLRCESLWEKFLIPAFIFFFQKLYPFPWVNNPRHPMAAAAGGCILIQRSALESIGGLNCVRQALIDDCSLASAVKSQIQATSENPTSAIWLGLSTQTRSLRPYDSLDTIWNMVARTAFTQLNYSIALLLGTLAGMTLVYLIAPIAVIVGVGMGNYGLMGLGGITWLLMAVSYLPTLRLYDLSPWWGLSLPVIALLYTLMTLDSALRYWQGKGGGWKGRVYSGIKN